MFDSGYTLPQGREVINYYYPLEYGFDGIIRIVKEMKDKVAGHADGDGLVSTNRLYNYELALYQSATVMNSIIAVTCILSVALVMRSLVFVSKEVESLLEFKCWSECSEASYKYSGACYTKWN